MEHGHSSGVQGFYLPSCSRKVRHGDLQDEQLPLIGQWSSLCCMHIARDTA